MAEIQVLRKQVAELIAAGEVIERPASVLKELTENAIDSGARHITAEIKQGGVRYLRVTDDGRGIAGEEVRTAFLRHATSKIREKDDLDHILTLGFRGEALASICAVSRTEVLTRQHGAKLGTHYVIEGGEEKTFEESGCPEGTTVMVRDLFYNVPVRAGFLKKDTAEGNASANVFQRIAISHPEISFRLIRENRTEFVTAGDGSLYAAIHAVFGADFAHDLLEVNYSETQGIEIDGYVLKPLYSRSNRSFQFFFVNGRSVRSFTLTNALEDAYKTLIMTGKYPACVLRLRIPPSAIDVNMHPTKAEVRFSDEKRVYAAVYFAVMNTLAQNRLIYDFELPRNEQTPFQPRRETSPVDWYAPVSEPNDAVPAPLFQKPPRQPVWQETPPEPVRTWEIPESVSVPESAFPDTESFARAVPEPPPREEPAAESSVAREPIRVIGELFETYILAEAGDQMVMIDKHAAHERILFERFRARTCTDRQQLLTPVKLMLSAEELDALREQAQTLRDCGFTFEFDDTAVVRMTGIPLSCADLDLDETAAALAKACAGLSEHPESHLLDDTLHTIACKAAIRSGDHTTPEELQHLAQQVWEDESIRHCPHGRPIVFLLSKYQIEKQFQRIPH